MTTTMIRVRGGGGSDRVAAGSSDDVAIPMPTWTDPTSIAAMLTAIAFAVNGILAASSTGYQLPPAALAAIPVVSFLIAGGVIFANIIRHSKATAAAIAR